MKPPIGAAKSSIGKRVLVVEDEVLVAMMIEDVVAAIGHVVVGPSRDVRQALRLVDGADCAVLDVNLNGELIYPVADALRRRGTPFIFVTGYGADGIRADYLDAPIIAKPFDEKILARAIRELAD
jgi:DNA-binding response OmpR family regulator